MKNEKLGRKLGAIALTGIIASTTILPCVVNASEIVKEDNLEVVSGESVAKNGKKKRKIKNQTVQNNGDTAKKEKYENLTDEEKEALKVERKTKKEENKVKYDDLTDEEKEAIKSERKDKKEEKKSKYEILTDEEKEALKAERKEMKKSNTEIKVKKQSRTKKTDKNVTSE